MNRLCKKLGGILETMLYFQRRAEAEAKANRDAGPYLRIARGYRKKAESLYAVIRLRKIEQNIITADLLAEFEAIAEEAFNV